MKKMTKEELLAKAEKPKKLAVKWHKFYKGKIETNLKVPVGSHKDFGVWYTPGVAEPSRKIKQNKDRAYDYTNKGNSIAILTDGSRTLGLGDVGPKASLPVMEGKAMLFKYLGGVDATPICLDADGHEEIINVVRQISPTFGGINLEDIEKPKCFLVLDELEEELDIPVWHDDQQGTAVITLAGLRNALKIVGKKLSEVTLAFIGIGAANTRNLDYIGKAGAKLENCIVVDSKGILHSGRTDVRDDPLKWRVCTETNADDRTGGIKEALEGADVCLAFSIPGPGAIRKDWISKMADDAIVFACANPVPEIWPWEAKEAGARVVATGRSDFKNQVNNALGFPAVFRGTLDVGAKTITDEMCLAASEAISEYVEESGLSEDYIIPLIEEEEVFIREAVAIGMKAIEQGVAKKKLSEEELEEKVTRTIKRAQNMPDVLTREGIIPPLPE